MILFYNAIRGLVYIAVWVAMTELLPQPQVKGANNSSVPCSNKLNENPEECSNLDYYIEYDDYKQLPAIGGELYLIIVFV